MADNPELHVRERGPGTALAAARNAQHLSVADVARQLKLSVSQVTALEAGAFERLPGPVFVRGFVRNYARLLKLDPDRLLDMVTDAPAAEPGKQMLIARGIPFPTASVRRWPRLLLLLTLLVVSALAFYEFRWSERVTFPRYGNAVTSVTVSEPKPAAAVSEVPGPAGNEVSAQPEAAPSSATQDAAPAAAELVIAEPAPVEPVPVEPTPVEPAPVEPLRADEGELHFTFEQDSWVQVRDGDGNIVLTRLNPAGTEQRVIGKPPFTLVIGNAGAVLLSYNEEAIDVGAHIVKDGVARFTLK